MFTFLANKQTSESKPDNLTNENQGVQGKNRYMSHPFMLLFFCMGQACSWPCLHRVLSWKGGKMLGAMRSAESGYKHEVAKGMAV